jgi:hypothetical protein
VGKQEQIDDLKKQVAELEHRIDSLEKRQEERFERLEGAARAFAVVYAIPRMETPGEDGQFEHR